jgi:2-methylisocitrate lyase-like PEP mutase family enzyme
MSLKEMVDNISRICDAVDIPVIADADTGYGSPLNVARTVRLYEKAGAAAIQLEDQEFPKRCGHMEGKRVIEAGEFVNKIRAAVDARHDPDFLIIARTDARAVFGLDEAIHRGQLYADAGADVIFVEAPLSVKEFQKIAESIDTPLLANMAEGAKSPMLSADELEKIGYKIVIYPVGTLFAAAHAIKQVALEIKRKGTDKGLLMKMETFSGFNELMGLKKHLEFSEKFS